MSTYTQHKGLEKPLSTEKYNVAVVNKNSDVIDSELHKLDLKNQSQDELLATKEALNAEISRAAAKENEIATNLENEVSRAKSVENKLVNELANEAGRATTAETDIRSILLNHMADKSNSHQVTKSQIGLGNVENKSSAAIRSEITKSNVTNALGYTPYTPNEVDNKLSALETNIDWKESVATFDDIATTYPDPQDGWTVNVNDTDYTYRYNGTSWIPISANAIPKATDSVDGLLSMEDHAKYEDANSKKHIHSNKSVLDGITSALITAWNNAVEHIADSIKHITSAERTNWNAAKTHADSAHAPSNAERNVIVTVKKNGNTVAPDDSRAINITIPTKTSELTNDSGFKTTDTTYSNFVKSGSGAKAGLVPAPSTIAGTTKYLREDGTWQVPPDTNLIGGGNVNGSLTIGNLDDLYMELSNDGIHGNKNQFLDGFHSVSAGTLYYDNEDLDDRYVKQEDLTPESISALSSKQLTSQDLNDTKNPGLYFGAGGNAVKNKPVGINNFGVAVLKSASGWVTQVLFGSDKQIYVRWYDGSTWTEWAKQDSGGNANIDLSAVPKIKNNPWEIDMESSNTLEIGRRISSVSQMFPKIEITDNRINLFSKGLTVNSNIASDADHSIIYISESDSVHMTPNGFAVSASGTGIGLATISKDITLNSARKTVSRSKDKTEFYAKELRLIPRGTDATREIPDHTYYVKTGNLQGVKDSNGEKPSISNYKRVGAELIEAGDMYGTLHGDVYYDYEYEDTHPDGILKSYSYSQFEAMGSHFTFDLYEHAEKKYDENGETEVRSNESISYTLNRYAFHPTVFTGGQPDLGYGGGARYRWNNVYAVNGTIQTSDRNEKNNIELISDKQAKSFILGLKPSTYKINEGTSGRTHWGLISQDIEELMESLDMDSTDFAGFIKSPKTIIVKEEEEYEDTDENGETIIKTRPVLKEQVVEGEFIYSLRYDEFIAPIIKVVQMQQNEIGDLKNTMQSQQTEIDDLKQTLNELKEMIKNGN